MLTSLIIATLLIIFAYFLGSLPTGYLAGRYLKGIDIREEGSGSIGATNVLRTLGKVPALVVLAIDLLKGSLALILVNWTYHFATELLPATWHPWLITATGLMAIIGHSKSIWLGFMGGKSVATSLGVLCVMSPVVGLGTLLTFALVLGISRIVSLSSIAGAIAVNILAIFTQQPLPYLIFTGLAGAYVILRHKSNIQRLLNGTEPKIGQQLQEKS
jgi:acyl phosphate:glycerol-3-phosphate acyltransferase